MTQYCRYCSLATLQDDDLVYCEAKKKQFTGEKAKRTNRCKEFQFNPVDVLNESGEYRPREPKKKNVDGQVRFSC